MTRSPARACETFIKDSLKHSLCGSPIGVYKLRSPGMQKALDTIAGGTVYLHRMRSIISKMLSLEE